MSSIISRSLASFQDIWEGVLFPANSVLCEVVSAVALVSWMAFFFIVGYEESLANLWIVVWLVLALLLMLTSGKLTNFFRAWRFWWDHGEKVYVRNHMVMIGNFSLALAAFVIAWLVPSLRMEIVYWFSELEASVQEFIGMSLVATWIGVLVVGVLIGAIAVFSWMGTTGIRKVVAIVMYIVFLMAMISLFVLQGHYQWGEELIQGLGVFLGRLIVGSIPFGWAYELFVRPMRMRMVEE